MRCLVTEPKEAIAQFVADRIGVDSAWGNYTTLASIDDKGIVVGVIYTNFTGRPGGYQDCSMHVAAREGAKWATRDFLHHAFAYPFIQMGCRRVTGLVPRKAKKVRRLDEHLGFEFEACLKRTIPGDDTIVYRMWSEKCRWIKMTSENVSPDDLIPIHSAWDEDRTNRIVASMNQNGWQGRPVLALSVNGRNLAMTGSHRIEAARRSGIDVPVHWVDTSKTSDSLLAQYLRACGDTESAFLLETELYEMGVA